MIEKKKITKQVLLVWKFFYCNDRKRKRRKKKSCFNWTFFYYNDKKEENKKVLLVWKQAQVYAMSPKHHPIMMHNP